MTTTIEPMYVNQQQAARLLSTTPLQIRRWEVAGHFVPSRIGGVVRYDVADLKAFMNLHRGSDGK